MCRISLEFRLLFLVIYFQLRFVGLLPDNYMNIFFFCLMRSFCNSETALPFGKLVFIQFSPEFQKLWLHFFLVIIFSIAEFTTLIESLQIDI